MKNINENGFEIINVNFDDNDNLVNDPLVDKIKETMFVIIDIENINSCENSKSFLENDIFNRTIGKINKQLESIGVSYIG